ncbi:MAG: hypothetical protein C5B55_04395 [Blastocatellia bacterium]|nr:MAG: hypothetical protein C5B55_04395 [Blastocatellia bacterium]
MSDKRSQAVNAVRETLFGDMPPSSWPSADSSVRGEPWDSFLQAREASAAGKTDQARQILYQIVGTPGFETRHYLQAWHFLRDLGEQPRREYAKKVLGVVVEVGLDEGLDIVAAYLDGNARYFNYSGAAVIWEHPNDSLDTEIEALLEAGQAVVQQTGPWDKARPDPPATGNVRINLLVPEGLNFGEGPFGALANDALGGPVISAAMALMQGLMSRTGRD